MGAWGKASRYKDSDSEKEEKYLEREVVGSRAKGQGSNWYNFNSSQWNQGMSYYEHNHNRYRYRYRSKDRDGDCKMKDSYKDKDGLYVPPGNYNATSLNSRMESFHKTC